MNEVRFAYKPKTVVFLLSVAFFAACAAILGSVALTNDRGLTLNRVINFSAEGATIFYWCLVLLSAGFVVVGLLAMIAGMKHQKEVVVTEHNLISPKSGFSKKNVSIAYADISGVELQSVQKQRFLYVHHPDGSLTIPQSMLASKEVFDELVQLIAARVDSSKPA